MKYIGAENDYAVFAHNSEAEKSIRTIIPDFPKVINDKLLTDKEVLLVDRPFDGIPRYHQFVVWLKNGSEAHIDDEITEYATAECETVEELVCAEKAGEIIVPKIFSNYNQEKIFVLKRTSDIYLRNTSGSHENYAVNPKLFNQIIGYDLYDPKIPLTDKQKILISHLVTRIIYTGAGHIYADEKMNTAKFILSPRTKFITRCFSNESLVNRPLIHQKDEELADQRIINISRLHLICGDMNRSDFSLYLKYGTTALLLAYLEISPQDELRKLVDKITLRKPLKYMHNLSSSVGGSAAFFARQFEKSVIIQKEIIKKIKSRQNELQKITNEFKKIIYYWEIAINAPSKMEDKLDWRIKKCFVENLIGDDISKLPNIKDKTLIKKILGLDLSYHRVNYRDFYKRLIEKGQITPMYSESKIIESVKKSPKGRASRRVNLTKYAIKKGNEKYVSLTWSEMRLKEYTHSMPIIICFDFKNETHSKNNIDKFLAGISDSYT